MTNVLSCVTVFVGKLRQKQKKKIEQRKNRNAFIPVSKAETMKQYFIVVYFIVIVNVFQKANGINTTYVFIRILLLLYY